MVIIEFFREYVNSFFVAMLVEQRVSLLNGDAGHILTTLMRFEKLKNQSLSLVHSAYHL